MSWPRLLCLGPPLQPGIESRFHYSERWGDAVSSLSGLVSVNWAVSVFNLRVRSSLFSGSQAGGATCLLTSGLRGKVGRLHAVLMLNLKSATATRCNCY